MIWDLKGLEEPNTETKTQNKTKQNKKTVEWFTPPDFKT